MNYGGKTSGTPGVIRKPFYNKWRGLILGQLIHSLEELLGRDGPVSEGVNGVDHQVGFTVVL